MKEEAMEIDVEVMDGIRHDIESSKNVPYFKRELEREVAKMLDLCEKWEAKLVAKRDVNFDLNDEKFLNEFKTTVDLNVDKEGEILAAIGQAKIMMGKKGRFQQFQDLINNCEFGHGEKKTSCLDLQGYWEMISLQVEKINKGFSKLFKLEENGWQQIDGVSDTTAAKNSELLNLIKKNSNSKSLKKVNTKKGSMTEAKKKPSTEIREMMAAKRREIALNKKKQLSSTEISSTLIKQSNKDAGIIASSSPTPVKMTTNETNTSDILKEENVFDGGFFSISSPQRRSPRLAHRHQNCSPHSVKGQNLGSNSTSAPSSATCTPNKLSTKYLRRSHLVDSAANILAHDSVRKSSSSFAVLRQVNSAIRKSMSHDEKSNMVPIFKRLRSRTIFN